MFKDLKIRPTIASGRGTGILEVHTNGFRYIYNGKENVDVPFKVLTYLIIVEYQTLYLPIPRIRDNCCSSLSFGVSNHPRQEEDLGHIILL